MASTQLTRTATSGTNTKATFSAWVKKADANEQFLFYHFGSSANNFRIRFDPDTIGVQTLSSSSSVMHLNTSAKFRDPSAWMHIVVAIDSTQATDTNRAKIYVNGVQQTSLSATTYPPQNQNMHFNESATVYIGGQAGSNYFNGSMTHVHWIDGTAYDADDFGESDSVSGIWKPKTAPSVTYGTNGFFLKMENSGAMGTDSSGNSNTFTVSGSLTQNVDTPSNNFATWNTQINNGISGDWSNGNLTVAPNSDSAYLYAPITIPVSNGKWYSEHMVTGGNGYGSIGFAGASKISDVFRNGNEPGNNANTFAFRCIGGGIKMADANTSYSSAPGTSSAILGIAVDIDNQKFWVSVNGTYVTYGGGVGNPAAGTYGFDWSSLSDDLGWLMICGDSEPNGYGNWKSNFGQGYFGTTAVASANADANGYGAMEYAVPSGYYTICTKNLKEFG